MAALHEPWHHKASSWKLWEWMGSSSDDLVGEMRHVLWSKRARKSHLPSSSKSTHIGHMARRMCLLQTEPHSRFSDFYSVLSHVTLLSTFSYLASNPSMITRLWKWEWFHFRPTTGLNAPWRLFTSGPLMRNLFHPTSFSQSSSSSPQFSSLQSENPVLKLWEYTEYIHLLLLHLALSCFNLRTNGHLPMCNSQASF